MKINQVITEGQQNCPECGGPAFSDLLLAEKKDACYAKVRSRYKVWPSAYASGALVQCRKKGAANWGNKSKNEGVAEAEKNPHTSASGKALYRDLSKEKKASPQQVQRNKERWAQRQAEREQGVAEGYQFKGPFPFDVDHMHGGRGINLPKAETKKYFTDKKQWQQAVDNINSSKYDDNSDYIGVTGRSTVEINGREWARWSDAQQKGYIELSSMSEQGVAEMDSQGYTGSRDRKKTSKYGSRDHYDLGGPESTGRPLTAKQMMDRAHKAMLKSMSNDEKVNKGWRNPNVKEGAGNIGNSIKALYQKIYRAGDDEIEYFYNDSPIFAQYWDEYEGDLNSIIAEVDPSELQIMLDELESYVQQANLAEADYSPMAKDSMKADKIRSLENLIVIAREQGRQLRVQELELELKKLQGVAEGKEDLASLRAKAKEISDKIDTIVKDGGRVGLDDPLSRRLKAIRAKIQQAKKQGVAEGETNPHTSALGKALYRDLSKQPKLSPQQVQRNKERWAQRQAEREQSVAEGMLDNPGQEDSPVAQAIIRRILLQRTDLLAKHGPERVGQAVDEVADFVGDVDEIGSSDVSGWVRQVEQMLGNIAEGDISQLEKDVADAPVKPIANMESATDSDGYSVDQEDAGEYDYEGDQAKDQLQTIVAAARKLDGILDDNENMPEWVQMKITKATDYLDTAADYVAANKAQSEPMAEADRKKIGGRHDPRDFDDMVLRLKKLAGAGPMQTVYDPQKRVYRNMPTAVQPKGKK